jgi:phosphatidylinositol 4-kinase type 2
LRENPWPDRYNSAFNTDVAPKKGSWAAMCLPGANGEDLEAQNNAAENSNSQQDPSPRFHWTEQLQQSFREELEKLVILDYMMRNTDRGLDNWMVKICWHNHDEDDEAHSNGGTQQNGNGKGNGVTSPGQKPVVVEPIPAAPLVDVRTSEASNSERVGTPQVGTSTPSQPGTPPNKGTPHIHIGAIDNSLAFPWKHPDEWRSFPLYSSSSW